MRATFGKTFNFGKIEESDRAQKSPNFHELIKRESIASNNQKSAEFASDAFEELEQIVGTEENFKELVMIVGSQLEQIRDPVTYKLILYKLHGAMMSMKRKDKITKDGEIRNSLEKILQNIPSQVPHLPLETLSTMLSFLSNLYSKTGLVSHHTNPALRAVTVQLEKKVTAEEERVPPGLLIMNLQSYSNLNFNLRVLLLALEKRLANTESELRLNILSQTSAFGYFKAVDPNKRQCPMTYATFYDQYMRIANLGILLGNIAEASLSEAKLFDLCNLLRIVAGLRIEVFSSNHMVKYDHPRYRELFPN